MHTTPPPANILMSMSEIADLAGVRRPVVTTWRRRHPDFPNPADRNGAQPLFDAREVCAWLVATGRAERHQVEAELALNTLTRLLPALPADELVATVTALICLRHLDGEPLVGGTYWEMEDLRERASKADPDDNLLCAEITALPDELAWLAAAVDDLVEAAWGCRGAFERIIEVRDRLGARDLCANAVAPELARLVAYLAGADEQARQRTSVVVADPAAGAGDLLAAAVQAAGEHAAPLVIAAEADRYLARFVRRRLAVHDVLVADQNVTVGDALDNDTVDPDVVVTQLPYRPQESRSGADVLARIDTVAVRLPPGRSAAVLGPAEVLTGALPRYSVAERARADLLASGVVEAVIRLPAGLVPFRPLYETAIWVLTPAYTSPRSGQVLLADLSNHDLTADVVDALVADVVTWRRDGYRSDAHTRALCAQVDIGRLLDQPGPLTVPPGPTARDLTTGAPAAVVRVNELQRTLDRLADRGQTARPPVRAGVARATSPRPRTVTIGALVQARRLVLISGARLAAEHVTTSGHHTVLGAAEVTGRVRAGHRSIDRAVLAAHYPKAVLTEPGDVVVTTTPSPGALVDHDGYSVVEFPARALRVPASERDQLPPRVLAALLTAGGRNGRRASAVPGVSRRLEDWVITLLDPVTAQRYDRMLADLDRRRGLVRQEADALDELDSVIATGLANGTLTLQP